MKLQVRFFASLKEQMGQDLVMVDAEFTPATVAGLKKHLCAQNPQFSKALGEVGRVRAAVNHDLAEDDTPLADQAEVAFFPPVTGG